MMNFIDFCTESEKVRKVRYSSNNNWVSAKRSYARRRRKTWRHPGPGRRWKARNN